MLFNDFLEWLQGIHPRYALLDTRNAFFHPTSHPVRTREQEDSKTQGYSSSSSKEDKEDDDKYRSLRNKQLKV